MTRPCIFPVRASARRPAERVASRATVLLARNPFHKAIAVSTRTGFGKPSAMGHHDLRTRSGRSRIPSTPRWERPKWRIDVGHRLVLLRVTGGAG